jgi:hypothetical protein
MHELYLNKPDRLLTHPSYRVCAIVDERDNASQTLDTLIKDGAKEEDIEILYGSEGIDLLSPKDTGQPFFSKIAKQFQSFGDMGTTLVQRYETALRRGGYVFVVPAHSDTEKETIRKSLGNVKAKEINAFSTWYMESIKGV